MERRGEGLTTEDLAGRRSEEDDLRIEHDDPAEGDRTDEAEAEPREGEPIAVGPVQDPPIILDERQRPESLSDETERSLQPEVERAEQAQPSDAGVAPAPPPPDEVTAEEVDLGREPPGGESSSTAAHEPSGAGPLIADTDRDEFTSRWKDVQFRFVEEPRSAVQQADGLVAEVMQRLAQTFADERARLESQWSQGDQVSTEDLRLAFKRYRDFFDRLLET